MRRTDVPLPVRRAARAGFLVRGACAAGLAVLLAVASCGTARRGEPLAGPFVPERASVQRGQIVFFEACHKCHPGGEAGLGPALNDKPLPVFLMKFQVRHGLGAMPEFDEKRITDAQLDDLMKFLVALRKHD